jgi:hypothetical protein
MKKSELEQIAWILRNEYGSADFGHWQIINAYKEGDGWHLIVTELKDDEKTEGAENADNQ